jgi:transglutaminase-like putative cysteine protease
MTCARHSVHVARSALALVPAALVLAWSWLRLQQSPRGLGEAAIVLVLALLPALAPSRRRRLLAALGAALLAVPYVALDERLGGAGAAGDRFARGIRAFYEVSLPFGPGHPAMHGVLLVALFGFALALALAVAERRAAAALAVLLVGAGWPATLLTGGEIVRGSAILAAALWLLAALGKARSPARPLAAGALVLVAAAVASTSSSVARGGLLDWQSWQLAGEAQDAVSVGYVWRASYDGLDWPERETTVLRVHGPARSLYWKATTLDAYGAGRWFEEPEPVADPLADRLLPPRGRDASNWLFTQVEVVGLHDRRLPAPGTPVHVSGSGVAYVSGGVRTGGLQRGDTYGISSYIPAPTPRQLARAGTVYPAAADRYLVVERGGAYEPLYRRALAVAGKAGSPYAAALSLESWFRTRGGFRYDEHPPAARAPVLVDFVVRTRAGYCQHFAGAMTLMLRMLGVPARVAVGFTSGSYDAGTREWTVTDHDAHAWVEAWFPGWGWVPFDPTPGRGDLEGSYTSASPSFDASGAAAAVGRSSALGASLAQRARAHPELIGGRPASAGDAIEHSGGRGTRLLALLGLLALTAAAALAAAKHVARRLAYRRAPDARGWAQAARLELTAYAADQRIELPAGATLAELVPVIRSRVGVDADPFARAATAAAYAGPARAEAAAADAARELRDLLRSLRRALPASRRLRGALSLRSL